MEENKMLKLKEDLKSGRIKAEELDEKTANEFVEFMKGHIRQKMDNLAKIDAQSKKLDKDILELKEESKKLEEKRVSLKKENEELENQIKKIQELNQEYSEKLNQFKDSEE